MIIIALRGTTDLRLPRRVGDEHRGMLRRFIKIGLPSFAEGISMWSVNIFILQFIATIGQRRGLEEGLQGVHIVAVQWEAFSFLPGFAIGTAAGTLAGQYLGANDPKQARRAVWLCVLITAAAMGAFGILFMTIGLPLTRLVSDNPLHLEEVPRLLFIAGVFQIPFAITMVLRQALRGVGDTRWCLFITTGSSYLVRLPLAWWLGVKLELGIAGVWWALMGELTLRAVLFGLRFRSRAWESTKV
jgi:Na+-driven multidrug efflux pump